MFISCSNQCKYADIPVGSSQELPAIFQIRKNVPILERLAVRDLTCSQEFDLFNMAPKLTEVSLSYLQLESLGDVTPWTFVDLPLNCHQIWWLKLWDGLPFATYASLLGSLTQLETFHLWNLLLDIGWYPGLLSKALDGPRSFTLPSVRKSFVNGHTSEYHSFLYYQIWKKFRFALDTSDAFILTCKADSRRQWKKEGKFVVQCKYFQWSQKQVLCRVCAGHNTMTKK